MKILLLFSMQTINEKAEAIKKYSSKPHEDAHYITFPNVLKLLNTIYL